MVVLLAGVLSISAAAQQTQLPPSPPPDAPSTSKISASSQPESEKEIQKNEQSQRILGVLPMFGVTSRQNAPPLTPHQKFHLFVKSAFDPFVYVAAGLQAGISQA